MAKPLPIPLQRTPGLTLIKDTPKGRGVFASQRIPSRTVIDVCPVLVLSPDENEQFIKHTSLIHYTYNWSGPSSRSPSAPGQHPNNGIRPMTASSASSSSPPLPPPPPQHQALILGLGSMFNHSSMGQNVGWERDVPNSLVRYVALRDIQPGEELCISYGLKLTFADADVNANGFGQDVEDDGLDSIDPSIIDQIVF